MIVDESHCFFDRHNVWLDVESPFERKVLRLFLTSNEWEMLRRNEFLLKLTKSTLWGAGLATVEGEESHHHLRFLTRILPEIRLRLPVCLSVDGCRFLFIEKLIGLVDGLSVEIRLPLRESYSQTDRQYCKRVLGEYRNPNHYRDMILKTAELADRLPYTRFRIRNPELLGDDGIASVRRALKGVRSPVVVGT
jgi:hypothetical protein